MAPQAVRAVLWDNDGVLVDTEPLFFEATREVLGEIGVELTEAAFRDLSLRRGITMFELARDRGYGAEDLERLRALRNVRYGRLLQRGVVVNPGVEEALASLRGRYRLAIVTSSRRDHFDLIHARAGLLGYFDLVLTAGDYGAHKPDPEPYREAAARLGVPPSACVVVEDSPRGVTSATEAGMVCLAVPNGLSRPGDLGGARRVLASVREVPAEVDRLARSR